MDRLTLILTAISGGSIAVALMIVAVASGVFNLPVLVACIVLGFGLAYPSSGLIARRISRNSKECTRRD